MTTSAGWNALDPGHEKLPKLLVKYRFDGSGYEVDLTDLSRIWREKVTRQQIIQRALDTGSSIDPGQDDEQFNIFLGKIEGALDHEDDTSLNLNSGNPDGRSLSLQISAKLPHPFPPLTWNIHLQQLPASQVEAQLVTPLIVQASRLRHQVEQLVNQLYDKDRVISKICDRLETSGNDLTTVFPGVSNIKTSRKKGQRDQLAKHVKGLADFDEYAWRAHHAKLEDSDGLQTERMEQVLRDLPTATSHANGTASHDVWWQQLGDRLSSQTTRSNDTHAKVSAQRPNASGASKNVDESKQDEEFQRQGTPPQLKKRSSPDELSAKDAASAPITINAKRSAVESAMVEDEDSTTEDEDDLDAAPRRPAPSSRQVRAPHKDTETIISPSPKKLSTIGDRSPKPSMPPVKEPTPEVKQAEPKPRSKLGTIGGKAKAAPGPPEPEAEKALCPAPPKKSKMGVIGGKKSSEERPSASLVEADDVSTTERAEPIRQGRSPVKEDTPQPIETSQERADRKRDQLKRELEDKAKVPAKKKRKF